MNFTINVIPDLLNFSISIVTTLVLYFFLRHFLFTPVTNFIEKRKKYVEDNISESEAKLAQSKEIKDEYESKLKDANIEASNILLDARKNYDSILASAKTDASKEKAKIISDAQKEAKLLKEKSMVSLKDDIVDIAIQTAKELSMSQVDEKQASMYTDKKIKELQDTKWEK